MTYPPRSNSIISTASERRHLIPPMGRWSVNGKSVLGVLVFGIIAAPFLEHSETGRFVESIMITLVLCTGVLAVGGKRSTLLVALALALPAVVAKWLNHLRPDLAPPELYLTFAILTAAYVTRQFLGFIMRARRVDSHVLCNGVASFLLLAMLWAFVYQLIDLQIPGSFVCTIASEPSRDMRGMFAFYFSLVTLCTVGFGDIVPASDVARMAAMLEGATGVFFVAVLISRLVSLYGIERAEHSVESERSAK